MYEEVSGALFLKVQLYTDDKKWAIFGKIEFQNLTILKTLSENLDRSIINMILCVYDSCAYKLLITRKNIYFLESIFSSLNFTDSGKN